MEQAERGRKYPSVIPRRDIPVAPGSDAASFEVRPFKAHELLGSVLPTSAVTLAWTQARSGRDVPLRSHPTSGLLIVLEGRAVLIGGLTRKVEAGDVVMLPRDHAYGFTAVGPDGLHALHVAFGAELAVRSDDAATLTQLLARNDARLQTTLNNSFFSLLRRGGIDSERKRAAMRECLRVFSDAFQVLLFTRQALCRDSRFAPAFHQHLVEELGHNRLLEVSGSSPLARDAQLHAASAWFCEQMLLADNIEKAAITLVLETGAYFVFTLSRPLFQGDTSQAYFDTHAEDDAEHKEQGARLLAGLHPEQYRRLRGVIDSAWDMVEAMTSRFTYLIELAERSS
jgi:hypothetical protein